jgi:hypothetical protein
MMQHVRLIVAINKNDAGERPFNTTTNQNRSISLLDSIAVNVHKVSSVCQMDRESYHGTIHHVEARSTKEVRMRHALPEFYCCRVKHIYSSRFFILAAPENINDDIAVFFWHAAKRK